MPSTPENGGFLLAAYLIAGTIYLGYAVVLWRKSREGRKD
jgi:hypothetical protein